MRNRALQRSAEYLASPRGKARWAGVFLRFMKRKPTGAAGAFVLAIFVISAVLAPWISPQDPRKADMRSMLQPPSMTHLFGTDNLGRDVLSRVFAGSRIAFRVGFLVVLLGTTLGAILGLVSGYSGGSLDLAMQRFFDVLMAFPALVLALTIVSMFEPSTNNVILALAVVTMPNAARVIRSQALAIKGFQYIEAARAVGCGNGRIIFLHLLPNCMAPYIIIATATLGAAILAEAGLSFLGLGSPPDVPTWGAMLATRAREFFNEAPWMAIFPGLALSSVVFGVNLLGDALRDVLDPRLRRG